MFGNGHVGVVKGRRGVLCVGYRESAALCRVQGGWRIGFATFGMCICLPPPVDLSERSSPGQKLCPNFSSSSVQICALVNRQALNPKP